MQELYNKISRFGLKKISYSYHNYMDWSDRAGRRGNVITAGVAMLVFLMHKNWFVVKC